MEAPEYDAVAGTFATNDERKALHKRGTGSAPWHHELIQVTDEI